MADHLLSEFCPTKFDRPNWCKNRYKRLFDTAKMVQIAKSLNLEIPSKTKLMLTTNDVILGPPKIEDTEPDLITLDKNIKLINDLMAGKKQLELRIDQVAETGINFNCINRKVKIANTNLTLIELGEFTILWAKKETLLIAKTLEITWISKH